ncbi:sensor histidine kinase [Agromyces bauzanensis]|uniref:Histidine kinase n=1 Tax=Agromyces bauzanensis TaxID=1308924 RepID=A0A917PIH6_9MICO|nr:GAF domain-containing protein [Agromyces bauzanensis]GGJ80374.1 histidine kinase [Agromyces bauzanensis]
MPERMLPPSDQPRSELDRALHDLVDRADDVTATQGRLRALLHATQAVVEPIELPMVLERIVRAGVELVDAEYGALGVVAPEGGLEEFIHVGMAPDAVARIGHLPEGHGVLGALIDDPRPIRLRHISDDPRSVGFPKGHPAMEAFLGVPIRVRDDVFGDLYLSNPRAGEFTLEDEDLVTALAATAGFAIANARLYDETRVRQSWTASSAQITSALLGTASAAAVPMLADELIARTGADRICIVVPGPDPLTVRVAEARGLGAETLGGAVIPWMRTAAAVVFESGESRARPGGRAGSTSDALAVMDGDGVGPTMFLALKNPSSAWGVVAVGRAPGKGHFTPAELGIGDDLANQVGLAIELARAREERQRALLADDRSRIARDLHDHVIQQLFGAGLELQALAGSTPERELARRLQSAVTTLDDTITQIRTIIFAMSPRPEADSSLRRRLLDIAAECSPSLPQPIAVSFSGPVDLIVTGDVAEDVAAVSRELLTNAVRHASASTVRLSIVANETAVRVTVDDDGTGIPASGRRSGLANVQTRAERRGGRLHIDSEPGRTTVRWTVPADPVDGVDA